MDQDFAHKSGDSARVVCAREPYGWQIQDAVAVPTKGGQKVITECPPPRVSVIERLPIDDDLHAVEWRCPKLQEVEHFPPMIDGDTRSNPLRQLEALEKLAGVDDPQDGRHNAHGRRYVVEVFQNCLEVFEAAAGWARLFTRYHLGYVSNVGRVCGDGLHRVLAGTSSSTNMLFPIPIRSRPTF